MTVNNSANLGFLMIVSASAVITFSIHVFLVRICGFFKKPFVRQKGVFISFVLGFIPVIYMFFMWSGDPVVKDRFQILYSGGYLFIVYAVSSYVYAHIFNLSETSRRIRILTECAKAGPLGKEELTAKYTYDEMVSNRLKRLEELGVLRLRGGRYTVKRGFLLLAARMVFGLRPLFFPLDS